MVDKQDASALDAANDQRRARAAIRDVDIARRALELLSDDGNQDYRAIAKARIDNPGATWMELGAALGLTKDQAFGRFRRMTQALRNQLW